MGNHTIGSQNVAIGGTTTFGHPPFAGMKLPSDEIGPVRDGDFDVGTKASEQLNHCVEPVFATEFGDHIGIRRDQDAVQRLKPRCKLFDPAFARPKEIRCRANLFTWITLDQLVAEPKKIGMEERLASGDGN
jgi:hypothetical protein